MLGKLFKYEFRALGRTLLPVYGAVLAMSVVSALFQKISPMNSLRSLAPVRIASAVSLVLYTCLIIASLVMSLVLSVSRYKKNIHETEGYLTNTLPVSTHSLISTKLITAVVYQLLGVVVAMLSGLIFVTINVGIKALDLRDLFGFIGRMFNQYGSDAVLYSVEIVLLALFTCLAVNLMFYASISIGHSFNGKKSAFTVGAFIVFYLIEQVINSNVMIVLSRIGLVNVDNVAGANIPYGLFHPYFIVAIFLDAIYCVAFYALCDYFVSHKLNLQ